MNSKTSTASAPDLVVIPQAGTLIPGQHLSQDDRAEVLKTWRDWGNTPTSPSRDYQVAVCHIIGGQPRITTTIKIPTR